jgi:hypothetical protein
MREQVFRGRYAAELDERGAVVFLIGMRINHWWRVDKWLRVATAMPRMLRHLEKADAGLLGWRVWLGRTVLVVQYWRSLDELHAFATTASSPHVAAWRQFNARVGSDGSVGIWHETYSVEPGTAEAIYGNMPVFGLAAATNHVPIGRGSQTAKARLSRDAAKKTS